MRDQLHIKAMDEFGRRFGGRPDAAAFAPGRFEVLGNHTDYNEGYVLSAATGQGTLFLARAAVSGGSCRVADAVLGKQAAFDLSSLAPGEGPDPAPWSRYIRGVVASLAATGRVRGGFDAVIASDLPLAAGLSSSAALEISAGMALCELYGIKVSRLELAKIAQKSEHEFVGVRCGLLDQISSLNGKAGRLVMTDFRSLSVETIPLGREHCFLACNTGVKHTLVDSAYNERRESCEQALGAFKAALGPRVSALRDVSWEDWKRLSGGMDPVAARRAAHVIGENTRVLAARRFLEANRLDDFGRLMFESHESSRHYFENSCEELDFIVETARPLAGVRGARLSGGGFGGAAIVLVAQGATDTTEIAIAEAFGRRFDRPCTTQLLVPSEGASLIGPARRSP